tara:strand:- start:201 stop:449 length:249 start_codon:yes stop_codon:yes gene_type:complete
MNHPLSSKPVPFHTHITFVGGDGHMESTAEENLESTITRLLRGPAAQMGIIKEVKIVEVATDSIVFLARDNNVVFPKPNKSK